MIDCTLCSGDCDCCGEDLCCVCRMGFGYITMACANCYDNVLVKIKLISRVILLTNFIKIS